MNVYMYYLLKMAQLQMHITKMALYGKQCNAIGQVLATNYQIGTLNMNE